MVGLTTSSKLPKHAGEGRLRWPPAESAQYDAGRDRVIVRLTIGIEIGVALTEVDGLQEASRDDLAVIEAEALGRHPLPATGCGTSTCRGFGATARFSARSAGPRGTGVRPDNVALSEVMT